MNHTVRKRQFPLTLRRCLSARAIASLAGIAVASAFTLPVWADPGDQLVVITSAADPNFDTQGNAQGGYIFAEYYGGPTVTPIPVIGNFTFVHNNARLTSPANLLNDVNQNTPNFGSDPADQALNNMSGACTFAYPGPDNPINMSLPTIPGHNYKLQLLFHDNWNDDNGTNNRIFSVVAGGQTLATNMSLVALRCNRNNAGDALVTNVFTATDTNYLVTLVPQVDNPCISMMTLVDYTCTPGILTSPTNLTVYDGNNGQFSVLAGGTGPFSYQWQGGASGSGGFTNLIDGANISGAKSNILSVFNVPLANVDYRVVVTNTCGAITSSVATLTVTTSGPVVTKDVKPSIQHPAGFARSFPVTVVGSKPVQYQWTRNGLPLSDGGRISGTHSNVLTIANTQSSDAGNYQCLITNAYGNTTSSLSALTIEPTFDIYDGTAWTTNGMTTIPISGVAQLTDGFGGEAASIFFDTPVNISSFKVSFIYQDIQGGLADGTALVFQNDPRGASALGGPGGQLGYGAAGEAAAVINSVALELNLFGTPGMALNTQGAVGGYVSTAPVDFTSGDPISVDVQYAGGNMAVTLTNLNTLDAFATNYTINIPSTVGGKLTAYIGFSGGDGGVASQQQVSSVTYALLPTTISLAPVGGQLQITYTGTLLSSTNAAGPYLPVTGAVSPYLVTPSGPQMFYRASNP